MNTGDNFLLRNRVKVIFTIDDYIAFATRKKRVVLLFGTRIGSR